MSAPVIIFSCNRSSDVTRCSTMGCGGIAIGRCSFPLRGRLEGKTCDRAVCAKCSAETKLCLAHQRLAKP